MIHPTEDDLEEYRRQDREEKAQAQAEDRRRREPPMGEPCEDCGGSGLGEDSSPEDIPGLILGSPCPCCDGTGVW